jgi:hypothetical protein
VPLVLEVVVFLSESSQPITANPNCSDWLKSRIPAVETTKRAGGSGMSTNKDNVVVAQGVTTMRTELEARREQLLRKLAQVERRIEQTQKRLAFLAQRLAPAKAA